MENQMSQTGKTRNSLRNNQSKLVILRIDVTEHAIPSFDVVILFDIVSLQNIHNETKIINSSEFE